MKIANDVIGDVRDHATTAVLAVNFLFTSHAIIITSKDARSTKI